RNSQTPNLLEFSACSSLTSSPAPPLTTYLRGIRQFPLPIILSGRNKFAPTILGLMATLIAAGKRENPCRALVVAEPPVTMDVSSKYTSEDMVKSYRKAVKLSCSECEELIISEPVREGEFVTTVNTTPPDYFYIYTNVIQALNIWLPFTAFEVDMLRVLNVAPTQLHPNSWAFIKAFEVICLGFGLDPSVAVFFSFYQIKNVKPNALVSISSQPNRGLFSLFASNFKNFKDSFFRVRCGENFSDLMYDELDEPLFPFYWTAKPRLIKGTIPEKLSEFESKTVDFLDSHALLDISDVIKSEGNAAALDEYLQRMRTISPAERAIFLAEARRQKTNPPATVVDPLTQLQIEDPAAKEGRSKRKHEGRISVPVPGKEGTSNSEVVPGNTAPPPQKKQRIRATAQIEGNVSKDKGTATVAVGSSQLASSDQTIPEATPLSWDAFDPVEFISRGVTMVGDDRYFASARTIVK
ncbi:hypothetical protein A2U01_0004747, partial [Trifolium medium]|nr:hypothetical protein [Trifolium medium]